MLQNNDIDVSVYNYFLNKDCRTLILYLLPQIHKGKIPPPGTSIISAIGSHTEKMLPFVNHFLNPCAQRVTSCVRDTTHFHTILEEVNELPEETWLVTADVTLPYTVIANISCIHAAKEAFHEFRRNPKVKASTDSLI